MTRAGISGALLLVALSAGCAAVPPQHVGVVETFGKVLDTTWAPGLHAWAPWTGVHRINCQTLQTEEKTATPTGEGLVVGLDVSLVYHAEPGSVADLRERLKGRGVYVEAILLRNIELPDQVARAVEAKLAADQQAQQMDFVLRKESKEAERKRIEAQGIADFQRIVTAGITPGLLTWKGIEATKDLAASPNAKVIIAGGRNGLPIILNAP